MILCMKQTSINNPGFNIPLISTTKNLHCLDSIFIELVKTLQNRNRQETHAKIQDSLNTQKYSKKYSDKNAHTFRSKVLI